MHVTVLQEHLLKVLTRTSRIISSRSQLPITQNVLVEANSRGVRIAATNVDTAENTWVGAKTEKPGGICVSSRLFTEFIASIPKAPVTLTVKDGALRITSGSFRATLPGLAAEEFPPLPSAEKNGASKIGKDTLIQALLRVMFSAATDEGRPTLTGIRILTHEDRTLFAATDGYRLSVCKADLKTKEQLDLLVPARALGEVVKIGLEEKEDGAVLLTKTGDGQLAFIVGDTDIFTRLIDGEYPNFEKIIPTTHTTRVLLDNENFVQAVRSASLFARDNANIVRIHIENQAVTVSANTPQVGENQVDVEASVDGEGGDIAFNSRFLLEFLANFTEEELLFEMTGSLNPGVFKPVKDESYLHIIMPVRVQG